MKTCFFIIALMILWTIGAENCNQYISGTLDTNQCLRRGENNTVTLQICPENLVCNIKTTENSSCASYIEAVKYPGEYCINKTECISASSEGDTCVGKAVNSDCGSDTECNYGLYCGNNGTAKSCVPVKREGESCNEAEKCDSFLACSNAVCVRIGYFPKYAYVTNENACTSLYALNQLCSDGPKLIGDKTEEPIENSTCVYKAGSTQLEEPCKCGINTEAKCYCNPGKGDMTNYIVDVKFTVIGR